MEKIKRHMQKSLSQALLLIAAVLTCMTACTKDEEGQQSSSILPEGAVQLAVTTGDFETTSSTRAESAIVSTETVELSDELSAEVTITEDNTPETRATTATRSALTAGMKFRVQAYQGTTLKTSILYEVQSDGSLLIVGGVNKDIDTGYGYVEAGGIKYFALVPHRNYTLVGYTNGSVADPGVIEGSTFSAIWRQNGMNFIVKDFTVGDKGEDNTLNVAFRHMNAAIQVVLNTEGVMQNVEAAEAGIYQSTNMPFQTTWNIFTDTYESHKTMTGAGGNVTAAVKWTNVAPSTSFASDLAYLTPGAYGSLKLDFSSITVNGVEYTNTNTITLSSLANLERNKKYKVTIKFIPPALLEYTNVDLYWGNDDVNGDGLVDVNGSNYTFKNFQYITAQKYDIYVRLPQGMHVDGTTIQTNPDIIKIPVGVKVGVNVKLDASLRGTTTNWTVHTTEANAKENTDIRQTIPVTWYNRLGYLAQAVGKEYGKSYSYANIQTESPETSSVLTFSNGGDGISVDRNTATPVVNATPTQKLDTREGIFISSTTSNGVTKKTKVYVQQNQFGFVSAGIYVRNGRYVIVDDGKVDEQVFFMVGSKIGIQGYSTNAPRVDGYSTSWYAWRTTDNYYTVDEQGKVTTHTGLTQDDIARGTKIYAIGDPCSYVYPMYSYRYANASEMDALVNGATHDVTKPGEVYMPMVKQTLQSQGAWRIWRKPYDEIDWANGSLSVISARWSGSNKAIDAYNGAVQSIFSNVHAARALCVRN